mmetsp:Transcript_44798/g.111554  ORF Transcript_44798/g.111554 Transcript_44798/m.111554 type:complete len:98 (-) Transcript_44798:1784-2077(-)
MTTTLSSYCVLCLFRLVRTLAGQPVAHYKRAVTAGRVSRCARTPASWSFKTVAEMRKKELSPTSTPSELAGVALLSMQSVREWSIEDILFEEHGGID